MEMIPTHKRTVSDTCSNVRKFKFISEKISNINTQQKFTFFEEFGSAGRMSPSNRYKQHNRMDSKLPPISNEDKDTLPSFINKRQTIKNNLKGSPNLIKMKRTRKYTSDSYIDNNKENSSGSTSVSPVSRNTFTLQKCISPSPKPDKMSLILGNMISGKLCTKKEKSFKKICQARIKLLNRIVNKDRNQNMIKLSKCMNSNSPAKTRKYSNDLRATKMKAPSPVKRQREDLQKKSFIKRGFIARAHEKLSKNARFSIKEAPQLSNKKLQMRRKLRKGTSNLHERVALSPPPQALSPLGSPNHAVIFSFDNFGDVETNNTTTTTRKCNMDLTKIVSDHELDQMKSQIMLTLNRNDL